MPVPTTRPTSAGTPTADVADVTFHYPVRPDITLDADDNLEELGELIVRAVTP